MEYVKDAEIVIPANVRFVSYAETPQMLANAEKPCNGKSECEEPLLINQLQRIQWESRLRLAVERGDLTLRDGGGYPVPFDIQGAMLDVNELSAYLEGVSAIRIHRQNSMHLAEHHMYSSQTLKEAPAQRRARWLEMFEAEEKRCKHGALQRLADSEQVDRSNLGKAIKKARSEREELKRQGINSWTSELVRDGKRKC